MAANLAFDVVTFTTAGGVPASRIARWLPANGDTADTDRDGLLEVCARDAVFGTRQPSRNDRIGPLAFPLAHLFQFILCQRNHPFRFGDACHLRGD